MRYFWPIARIVFCPLTILFIYLTVTEPSADKKIKAPTLLGEGMTLQAETFVIAMHV